MAKRIVQSFSVESITVPIGTIIFSPKGTVPSGFLACEGGSFSSTTYPELYAYLGSTTLPDFRDRVPRGAGTLAGSAGTTQEDAFQGHWHDIWGTGQQGVNSGNADDITIINSLLSSVAVRGAVTDGVNGTPRTASETRAKAYIGKFVIKAFDVAVNQGTVDIGELADDVSTNTSNLSSVITDVNALKLKGQLIHVRDEKAQNTSGGYGGGAGIFDRTLNTVKINTITGASLSSNQITLPAGTYWVEGEIQSWKSGYTRVLMTDNSNNILLMGLSQLQDGNNITQTLFLRGGFILASPGIVKVRHRISASDVQNFGIAINSDGVEVYADLKIWRFG